MILVLLTWFIFIFIIIYKYNLFNNIVILFSKGYSEQLLKLFFITLKKASPNTYILIFSDNITINVAKQNFLKQKVIGIEFLNSYPYYQFNNNQYPISNEELKIYIPTYINTKDRYFYHTIRFFLINVWINKYGYKFKFVLTCDIKDILFQKDPFSICKKKGIYFQEEVYSRNNIGGIIACPHNRRWIEPYNASYDILTKPIINSGQIIGTSLEMKKFISEFCNFMTYTKIRTAEQGSLNYFIYTRKFNYNFYIKKHGYGYALILHYLLRFTIDNFTPINNYLYNLDNTIPPIIHSYLYGLLYGSNRRKRKFRKYIDFYKYYK